MISAITVPSSISPNNGAPADFDSDVEMIGEEFGNEEAMIDEKVTQPEIQYSQKKMEAPKIGMSFDSIESILDFYQDYGKQEGFRVCKRTSSNGYDDIKRYVTISCSRSGKAKSTSKNVLQPRPLAKTGCEAKLNAKLREDGKWHVSGVVLDHNHSLSPGKIRLHRSCRRIEPHAKRQLLFLAKAEVRINQSINVVALEANGHENLSFIEKGARNFIDKEKRLNLGSGDAEALQCYFTKVQATDSNFFFTIDFDEENRIRNLFWADARSRAAYEEFGDVITFDTTYLTNRYDMPFAPFVGVNHHGQSTLLGCGLISIEDTETFRWLFRAWLTCMHNKAPNAIITDQDKVMRKAIELVFPNSRHRWCLWHIMKKVPERFAAHNEYEAITYALKNCVYNSLSHVEFEASWIEMLKMYGLQNNEWLMGLYSETYRWVPCFVKDCFWAGMSTTQRSESMNSFFDGYVNAKTSLKQFVEKYEHALRSKVRKEQEEYAICFYSSIPCVTIYYMEKQVQEAYTTPKFKEFQTELTGKMYCDITRAEACGAILNYDVSEDILVGENKKIRKVKFKVCLVKEENDEECDVKCNCRLFEFRGILCRHVIAVLIKENIYSIPTKYILRRWRKDIKRRHTKVRVAYSDWGTSEEGRRYDYMCKGFFEVADLAYEFEEKCKLVNETIAALKQELTKHENLCENSQHTPPSNSRSVAKDISKETTKLLTPLVVHGKGRPRFKRKQSKVEQVVTKKRLKKIDLKEKTNQRKKGYSLRRKGEEVYTAGNQDGNETNRIHQMANPSDVIEQVGVVGTQESITLMANPSAITEQVGVVGTQESIILMESQSTPIFQNNDRNVSPPTLAYEIYPTSCEFVQPYLPRNTSVSFPYLISSQREVNASDFRQPPNYFTQMLEFDTEGHQSWQGGDISNIGD